MASGSLWGTVLSAAIAVVVVVISLASLAVVLSRYRLDYSRWSAFSAGVRVSLVSRCAPDRRRLRSSRMDRPLSLTAKQIPLFSLFSECVGFRDPMLIPPGQAHCGLARYETRRG